MYGSNTKVTKLVRATKPIKIVNSIESIKHGVMCR